MESEKVVEARAALRQFVEANLRVQSIETSVHYRFMHAVDDEIKSDMSPLALATALGSMRIFINEYGFKVAIEEKAHVALARHIDLTYAYSILHYGNEDFFIANMEQNPPTINVVL
jgi:hypothetical protein